ncbi:Poly [ADP-ribose] polymerase 2-A [Vitis vinifera]|uniref:Poly [ADP-ribose] polymerase n=1 Tax=Vitis vinifera TaxID=29760 RepID=A0A438F3M2_VITVI|nr:Poly [ADP-ribose] polymerase 2-A [Vitis vinifera]
MASKLKVDELRAQLAQRGLSTAGPKPTLVRRLESALRKENKQHSTDGVDSSSTSKKRPSQAQNGNDSHVSKKSKAVDEEGVDKVHEDGGKEEKLVTATKKGGAVLDQWLPDQIKANYHVLEQGDDIYDAMLNQTNVGDNNNKFYVIQVLESDDGGKFMAYARWGRVGVKGQDKLQGPFTSRESAIHEFEQKFYAKTKNYWSNRKDFIGHPKCYTWLEMDYNDKEQKSDVQEKPNSTIQLRETKLEPRIAKFISLICDVSMMKQQMMEIGYNADKLPLGKLSKSTISKGYDVLKRIADVISQSNRKTLEQLSGEFYTVIPHDFGFKKMRDFVIDTPQKLKHKLEMVEALGEIEVATKLLKDDIGTQEDPLHMHYQRLHCEMIPLEVNSEEFSMIAKYMENTHAETHSNYTVDIVQIFRVSREGEVERFRKFSSTKNRMLLWHGSRLTNWTGILSQGLRIAPPEAPATGYMFGKGVYFADMFSKSANYSYPSCAMTTGVLVLCEVALGDMAELLTANCNADKLPEGKLSTKGIGATAPDPSEAQAFENGIVVPLGKPKLRSDPKGDLLYNEYIVYNVDQIRMRYVVQVTFNFKR